MKTLKFRHNLIEEILSGRKTATWRLFDDKDLRVGDKIELLDWDSKEKFAEAEIVNIEEKKLQDVTDEDFRGHEKFENKEEMMETYKGYYGERVDGNVIMKIIEFRLLKP